MKRPPQRPQLLVSVRDVQEADDAIAGGCDILDVKEPAHGSLGMADVAVIREVVAAAGVQASACPDVRSRAIDPTTGSLKTELQRPVSAALGETRDWRNCKHVPELPHGLQYAKLGTAGLADVARWEHEWRMVRERFEAIAKSPLQWIAVAYADWQQAAAPPPQEILHAAIESDCAGLLIDTCHKDGRSLFDALPFDVIAGLLETLRASNLFVALAGSLSIADLERAAALRPEVIAVRSAACRNGIRSAPVCRESVQQIRQTLDALSAIHR